MWDPPEFLSTGLAAPTSGRAAQLWEKTLFHGRTRWYQVGLSPSSPAHVHGAGPVSDPDLPQHLPLDRV